MNFILYLVIWWGTANRLVDIYFRSKPSVTQSSYLTYLTYFGHNKEKKRLFSFPIKENILSPTHSSPIINPITQFWLKHIELRKNWHTDLVITGISRQIINV